LLAATAINQFQLENRSALVSRERLRPAPVRIPSGDDVTVSLEKVNVTSEVTDDLGWRAGDRGHHLAGGETNTVTLPVELERDAGAKRCAGRFR
jgi:hypothetical protein